MADITVDELGKTYVVPERDGGLKAALTSLARRRTRSVEAVAGVSFTIDHGEVVGFLGPNGAGKTTTLKMLAGLLHPTSGRADVLGFTPWRRDRDYLGRMALVMGNRNQLQWDIPVLDSYRLYQAIFRIAPTDFTRRLTELTDLLELGDLLRKPVRNLSLGERMSVRSRARCCTIPRSCFSTSRPSGSTSPCSDGSAPSWPSTTSGPARASCSPATTWLTSRRCADA